MVTCSMCGTVSESETDSHTDSQADSETPPLTWVSSLENGRSRWYCDDCSRSHLRAMEAKLDSEWW